MALPRCLCRLTLEKEGSGDDGFMKGFVWDEGQIAVFCCLGRLYPHVDFGRLGQG